MKHREKFLTLASEIRGQHRSDLNLDSQINLYMTVLWSDDRGGDQGYSGETHEITATRPHLECEVGQMIELYDLSASYEFIRDLLMEESEYPLRDVFFSASPVEYVEPAGESVEGAIILRWAWCTYLGYSRDFQEVRRGRYDETEASLMQGSGHESVGRPVEEVIIRAEDVEGLSDDELIEAVGSALSGDQWKWNGFRVIPVARERVADMLGISLPPTFEELCAEHSLPRSVGVPA